MHVCKYIVSGLVATYLFSITAFFFVTFLSSWIIESVAGRLTMSMGYNDLPLPKFSSSYLFAI